MIRRIFCYIFSIYLVQYTQASYCGQSAIPFTFQVLHSGLPVLGCARPNCFGWNANGTRADETAMFYKINGKEDGYLRHSDQADRSPYRDQGMVARVAKCQETYSKNGCEEGQWIGGIAPQGISQGSDLQVRCCSYAPLLESEDRGVAMVTNGQLVVGGEVMNGDALEGFDYIADIKTEGIKNGRKVYAVSIRRMTCTDDNTVTVTDNAVLQKLDGDAQTNAKADYQTGASMNSPTLRTDNVMAGPPAPQHSTPQRSGSVHVGPPGYAQPQQQNNQQQQLQLQLQQQPQPQQQQQQLLQQQPQQQQQQQQQLQPQQQQQQQPMVMSPSPQPQYALGQMTNMIQSPVLPGLIPPQQYNPFNQLPMQQIPQPIGGMYGQQPNLYMPLQQVPAATQQQSQFQPQPQLQPQVVQPLSTTPLPTLPPLTFPSLEQIPKIDIPSVEDVENVIPPVQRAILTTVARFFGVL
ncbi:hypothetical protein V3C99_018897 [Haemonchus contortus]